MQQNLRHPPDRQPPAPVAALGDKPFSVAFDGTVLSGILNVKTVRDFDRLMKVLTAQRGVLEAMEDDDHADQIDPFS